MAARADASPLSFEDICEKIRQVGTSRILPTAVLVGSLEGAEVRVLAHLVRCRASGFMVLLPALEEVLAILEQLVDGDGDSLVVQKEVDVPLEDARGRRFGSGQMVLVDMPAECAAHFVRTPALRGNAAAGLLRMMAQNSIARPSMRGAHQAAELWISELAEADEVLLEHFTAEEGEAASPVQSNVSPEVVQQLQARIAQLETQQAAPSGGLAPVVDLEPRPHAAGRSVLFAPGTVSEALADENPAAQQAFAHAEAEVEAGDEVSQVLNASSDPLHQLLALQMKQTAALMQKLAPPTRDPVTAALGSEGGSSQSGVKGCVARDAYLRTMEDVKGTGRSIASNAAVDLGLPADQVNSCLMRSYVEKRMPLEDQRQLTYLAQYMAVAWQMSCEAKNEFSMGLFARGLMMVEQIALDQGRCQFGWLLAAMPDPNLQTITMNRRRIGLTPYAKLASAPWVAGNIAYLKDLDYLEGRLKNTKSADKPSKDDPADEDVPKGPRKPWKPQKGRGKAKDETSDSAAPS